MRGRGVPFLHQPPTHLPLDDNENLNQQVLNKTKYSIMMRLRRKSSKSRLPQHHYPPSSIEERNEKYQHQRQDVCDDQIRDPSCSDEPNWAFKTEEKPSTPLSVQIHDVVKKGNTELKREKSFVSEPGTSRYSKKLGSDEISKSSNLSDKKLFHKCNDSEKMSPEYLVLDQGEESGIGVVRQCESNETLTTQKLPDVNSNLVNADEAAIAIQPSQSTQEEHPIGEEARVKSPEEKPQQKKLPTENYTGGWLATKRTVSGLTMPSDYDSSIASTQFEEYDHFRPIPRVILLSKQLDVDVESQQKLGRTGDIPNEVEFSADDLDLEITETWEGTETREYQAQHDKARHRRGRSDFAFDGRFADDYYEWEDPSTVEFCTLESFSFDKNTTGYFTYATNTLKKISRAVDDTLGPTIDRAYSLINPTTKERAKSGSIVDEPFSPSEIMSAAIPSLRRQLAKDDEDKSAWLSKQSTRKNNTDTTTAKSDNNHQTIFHALKNCNGVDNTTDGTSVVNRQRTGSSYHHQQQPQRTPSVRKGPIANFGITVVDETFENGSHLLKNYKKSKGEMTATSPSNVGPVCGFSSFWINSPK